MTRLPRIALVLSLSVAAVPAVAQQGGGAPTVDLPIIGEVAVPGFLANLFGLEANGASGGGSGAGEAPPPAVVFEVAKERAVAESYRFLGRISPIERVEIRARVPGYIEEVAFSGGASVSEGDLLFQIERDTYEVALNAARARLAAAEAQLDETERQLSRQRQLAESGTVSEANLDDAIAAAEGARASRQEAEAAVSQAELDLGYTSIEAAIDGKISAPAQTRGNYVSASSGSLAELVQLDPIWGVFALGETRLETWRNLGLDGGSPTGYDLSLVLPDGTTYAEGGDFDFLGNEVDAATGTVAVRVRFANPDGTLLPNQNVTLRVVESDPPVLPVIPQAAVQLGREGRAVWTVEDDDTVTRRPISVVEGPEPGTVAVTDGLAGGERVIVRGALRLSDGQTVDPRNADGSGGGTAGGSGGDRGGDDAQGAAGGGGSGDGGEGDAEQGA